MNLEVESQSFYKNKFDHKILVTGASGFIGSKLLKQLIEIDDEKINTGEGNYSIRCLTRNKNVLNSTPLKRNGEPSSVEVVEGDLSNYEDCLRALKDVDIAYYLVHSMEGSSKNWKRFSEKEKKYCREFCKSGR